MVLISMTLVLTKGSGVCGSYLIIDYQIWSARSIFPEVCPVAWWLSWIHRVARHTCLVGGPWRTRPVVHLFLHLKCEIILHRLFLCGCTSIDCGISQSLVIKHIKSSRSRSNLRCGLSSLLFIEFGSECFTFKLEFFDLFLTSFNLILSSS